MMFSIIIPTYNRGYRIEDTLKSILTQEERDFECIVVDDGSSDDTREVVTRTMQADKRVRYVYQANAGQARARQNGLVHAQGTWVVYVDSDDVLYPQFLGQVRAAVCSNANTMFATTGMDRFLQLVGEDGKVLQRLEQQPTTKDPSTITIKDYGNWDIKPCGTGIVHRREEALDAGIAWDSSFTMLEDFDFLLQLASAFPQGFQYVPERLMEYTQVWGGDGVCGGASYADYAEAFEQIYKKHKDNPALAKQQWYPEKVQKYKKLQKQFDAGKVQAPAYELVFADVEAKA